jgi:predicted amidohydrolase YtcJ
LRGKPIILFRTDYHVAWVSGRALELCGKLPKTVTGGEIVRDASGKPTGVFMDLAQLLIPRPAWTTNQMHEFFQRAIKDMLKVGLTAAHDAMTQAHMIEFYKLLVQFHDICDY